MSVVDSCICLKLRMIARTTAVLYDAALQPTGLNAAQFSALRNIYRFVPLGVSQLAEVMLLERTTLTRNLQLLASKSLVELQVSEVDQRIQIPALTDAGIETLKAAVPKWRLAQRRLLGGLGTAGWNEILATLRAAAALNEQAPRRLYVMSHDAEGFDETDGTSDSIDFQRCANSTLRGAARYVTREYDAILRPEAIKSTQFHVLAAVAENRNVRVQDIATLLALDQASATLAINGLKRLKWIEKAKKPSVGLSLTAAGLRTFEAATPLWLKAQRSRMPDAALSKWNGILDKALMAALKAKAL
ncbi:MarR family transcriptional regulator [Bradyrhizobium sp. INPA01-394B]|uniref:MarR family transcriptional regulator n=1 Tax=Bradyrhizobium campsiandrae TaxID=1729892 RepID=A0ABR7U4R6_9BRAD|nr:MarR family transcriptional regulator [Bradyrhizobium campsiandrae]MBC9879883.1 MarR family transcriptional regulator [Bradyrhizobium campsiandrae]MBC9978568.1 MarR family transcriptional regulator [Bradyrhizobium campsiandrae]